MSRESTRLMSKNGPLYRARVQRKEARKRALKLARKGGKLWRS